MYEVSPRLWNDRDETCQQLERGEEQTGRAVVPAALEAEKQASLRRLCKSVVRDRGTLDVAEEPLPGFGVVGPDANGGVQVEESGGSAAVGELARVGVEHPAGLASGAEPEGVATGGGGGEEETVGLVVLVGGGHLFLVALESDLTQEPLDPSANTIDHLLDVRRGGRGDGVEHRPRLAVTINTVDHDRMKVYVQVERRAKHLIERDRAAPALGEACGVAVPGEHGVEEESEDPSAQRSVPARRSRRGMGSERTH
jgi:hypothetical protein